MKERVPKPAGPQIELFVDKDKQWIRIKLGDRAVILPIGDWAKLLAHPQQMIMNDCQGERA